MKKIYIAGSYTAETDSEKQKNIVQAMDAAAELFWRGWAPFCPHTMTADFDILYPRIPYETYLKTDLAWLECCDTILMLPGWENSKGAQAERDRSVELKQVGYYSLDDVPDLAKGGDTND